MGNKGPLKVLNGTKLILDDHGNNLDSFRNQNHILSVWNPLGPSTQNSNWSGTSFFFISYSKQALDIFTKNFKFIGAQFTF